MKAVLIRGLKGVLRRLEAAASADAAARRDPIVATLRFEALQGSPILRHAGDPLPPGAKGGAVGAFTTFCGPRAAFNLTRDVRDLAHDFHVISNNDDCLRFAEGLGWVPLFLDTPVVADAVTSATQAKLAKALPHRFARLNSYDHLVYFDDKITAAPGQVQALADLFVHRDDIAMAVTRHPFLKDSVLHELAEAMGQPRYFAQRRETVGFIAAQMAAGAAVNGIEMFATGYSIRNMRHTDTAAIGEDWYRAINACGIECQIAFDMIAQRYASIEAFDGALFQQ